MIKTEPIPYMEFTPSSTPVQELYTAVIERMLRDALYSNSADRFGAIQWLLDNNTRKNSFLYMCEICDISDKFIKRVRLACIG